MMNELGAQPAFDAALFQRELRTEQIGRFMVYRAATETTMTLARREADEGGAHGTLVLAEEQTAGRGRRGRSFYSPAGENLYFTLVLRCDLEAHRRLPLTVPLAVARACRSEGVDARIKWPNDIWVGERKLSGMLIDAEVTPRGAVAFPGIGINVNGDPTLNPELRDIATSFARELGRRVSRERLLASVCNSLEAAIELEPAALAASYRERSMILGREIRVQPLGADAYAARAVDIEADGTLLVVKEDGTRETVAAADVSVRPA